MVTEARVQMGTTPTSAHVSHPGLELTVNKVTTNCLIKKLELSGLDFQITNVYFTFFIIQFSNRPKFTVYQLYKRQYFMTVDHNFQDRVYFLSSVAV